EMPVADFLTGPFSTALRPDELLTAVILPRPSKGARWGYWKFCRQVGEFAKASAAVLIDPAGLGPGLGLRCAVGALGRQPLLLDDPAALIEGRVSPVEALEKALPDRAPAELTLHATALTRALKQAKGEE
ncbi:MAG: carbon monoxide dehydrogenase, partial [Oceanibaculum nanhaiense]